MEISGKQVIVERVVTDSGQVLQRTPIETSTGTVYSWAEDDRYLVRVKNRGFLRGYLRTRLPKDSYIITSEVPLEERGSEAVYVVKRTGSSDLEFRQVLSKHSDIIEVEASPIYEEQSVYSVVDTIPDDPVFEASWHLHNTGQNYLEIPIPPFTFNGTADADIDFLESRMLLDATNTVVVAVLDSGVRYTHDDLDDNMWVDPSPGVWFSQANPGASYISGVHGIDLGDMDSDPYQGHINSHGTQVSSALASEVDNQLGTASIGGVNVEIMAIRHTNAAGVITSEAVIDGIYFAVDHGARIINCSFGRYDPEPEVETSSEILLERAVDFARSHGVVLVCSAGNGLKDDPSCQDVPGNLCPRSPVDIDEFPMYPAAFSVTHDNVISVTGTDPRDFRVGVFNVGIDAVQIAAPGWDIHVAIGASDTSTSSLTTPVLVSGTSFSAPVASGLLAAVMAKYDNEPYQDSIRRVEENCDTLASLATSCSTSGRINAHRSLGLFGLHPRMNSLGFTRDVDWFAGWIDDGEYPLVYHSKLGEMLFYSGTKSEDYIWFQLALFTSYSSDWVYTDQTMFPMIYRLADDAFLSWYSTSPSGVVFWNHKTLSWETHQL